MGYLSKGITADFTIIGIEKINLPGEVIAEPSGRLVDILTGELLPRICLTAAEEAGGLTD